jgi:DNA ligase-1
MMRQFAKLLDQLYFTYSHLEKLTLLKNYFSNTEDPERGFALAIISGEIKFPAFKRNLIREVIADRIDPVLFDLSYDYVGDLSETVALLWPVLPNAKLTDLPPLSELIAQFTNLSKEDTKGYLSTLLDNANASERWALLKLGTGGLRIGVSARFLKQALAQFGEKDIQEIEHIWHSLKPPYLELFAWLAGHSAKPDVSAAIYFHPVMLSHPLSDEELIKITPADFAVEKKIDGIRVQLVSTKNGKAIYTRTGDDISAAFPDAMTELHSAVVLDGELVIYHEKGLGSFNDLQQRLNRKAPSKKMLQDAPAHIILYDILICEGNDLRQMTFTARRQQLENWYEKYKPDNMSLSALIDFSAADQLATLREQVLEDKHVAIEGLMLKRKDSLYIAGRPSGLWYKWKRDPLLVDCVLMYAQRGHGKRSSYYSDYTFGLWQDDELLPICKAYSGFTDEELLQLDKWVRHHTIKTYGPVREVEKKLVFEIAFDAINFSKRHKSAIALRFPRVNRIRWDKPATEVDTLVNLKNLIRTDSPQS